MRFAICDLRISTAHFNLSSRSFRSLWAKTRSFAPHKPRGVHDAGVNQFVNDDDVVLADQGANGAEGGGVAGGKGQRGFGAFEAGERFLQFMKRRERAANQPRRAGARAKFFNGLDRGLFQSRMVGEAEIIVGRKIEKRFAADLDARALRRIHAAQFAEQVLFAQGVRGVGSIRRQTDSIRPQINTDGLAMERQPCGPSANHMRRNRPVSVNHAGA